MADYTANSKNNQKNNRIPGSTSRNYSNRSTSTLLPDYFQTDLNKKILSTTLDKLNQSGDAENISAYIGKKTSNIRNSSDDVYINSSTTLKNRYQLDPAVISQDPASLDYEKIITYDDIITKLKYLDSNTTNLDKLFSDNSYSWTPPIDYDMFVNWNRYVWIPYGLPLIGLHEENKANIEGKRTYTTSAQAIHGERTLTLENGMRLAFSDDNKIYRVSGVGTKIVLTDESTLTEVTETSMGIATPTQATGTVTTSTTNNPVTSPTLGVGGADYVYPPFCNVYDVAGSPSTHAVLTATLANGAVTGFTQSVAGAGYTGSGVELLIMGGQKRRPEKLIDSNKDVNWTAQYITISRECRDNNAWSRANNWYHIDTIKAVNTMLGLTQSFKIDGTITDDDYAQRPIICWERDLHLYNHGTHFRKPVDIIISEAMNVTDGDNGFRQPNNPADEVHDGYTIQNGDRVLFTNATSDTYKNKIFTVNTNQTGASALTLATDGRGSGTPTHGDVITCLNGASLWNSSSTYTTGSIVKHNDNYYIDASGSSTNKGKEPGIDHGEVTYWNLTTVTSEQGIDYWFNGKTQTWIKCQEKPKANIPPNFELYDTLNNPLSEYNSNDFFGNTVFEYLEDTITSTRTDDSYLGFPLTYNTSSYITTTNTSNIVFSNSIKQTIYQYNKATTPVDILGFYYLRKYDRDTTKYSFNNCWSQSYKQVRTPITVTQDVTNAQDDFVIDLGTTNFEPERDYWVQASATGWEFYLKSAYGFEKLSGINPTLYLAKGQTYTFDITNGTTALQIQDSGGTAYSGNSTVTNNNNNNATITFAIASNETNNILYYSAPGSTTGKIIIIEELQEQGWPEVFHNGNKLSRNNHYIFNGQKMVIPYESIGTDETIIANGVTVFSPSNLAQSKENILSEGDIVDVKFFTTDTSSTDEWAYDVPFILKNNASNNDVGNVKYSEIFNHFKSIINAQPELTGSAFGNNNYRNILQEKKLGGIVNQQLSPMLKLGLTLADENYDTQLALDYVSDAYSVFKKKFVQKIEQLNKSEASTTKLSTLVDQALYDINLGKNNTFPFANSDMAYYFNMVEKTYNVSSSTSDFNLPRNITRTKQYKNHVYVYTIDTNGVETFLTSDLYTLDTTSTTNKITLDSAVSSGKVVIKVSIDEGLSFIPPTLAKLGVSPAIKPNSYVDETGTRTVVVIEGHDGSKTVAFKSSITGAAGSHSHTITDIRDKALLELENRIYDHIQSSFKNKRKDLSLIPGKYRTTPYTLTQQNAFYDDSFNAYKNKKGVTILSNSSYDANNKFTHNYSSTQTEGIGFWRGIYKYYFDTDRPHTHPWEMLGFTEKPSWWDTHYEWVNNTKRNNLINALQKGIISEHGQTIVQDINVARPSATFPVATDGSLQDPDTWGVTSPTTQNAMSDFKFGDGGPIETVWNRSVLFPFHEYNWKQSARPTQTFEENYDTLDRINDGIVSVTIKITVANDGTANRFYLDGVPQKKIVLQKGITYTFDLSDTSIGSHVFQLSATYDNSGNSQYASGWGGTAAARTFTPQSGAPDVLYYFCAAPHAGMGGTIEIVDVSQEKQIISDKTKQRHNSNLLYIHNEIDTTDLSRRILGIQQPIVDRLMYLGNNINEDFAKQIKQLDTQLAFRMEGYSSKTSVSLLADSLPSEKSNNFIPEDDIFIKFYTSSPYKYYCYSGVEIIKTSKGYKITGWDNDRPYFNILPSIRINQKFITVSNTNLYYFSEYETISKKVLYGTEFLTINDVYLFLLEYEKYLESVGFVFNNYDTNNNVQNWSLSGNQFVIWAETKYDNNTSIQISPAGESVYLTYVQGHAKSNLYKYGSSFKDKDSKTFDGKDINFDRQNDYISVSPKSTTRAIYFAKFVFCDYEHVLLMNNKTIFDDVIYEPLFGSIKNRFKIDFLKTTDWNGTLNAPGYIINNDTVYENFDKSIANINRGLFDAEQTLLDTNLRDVARKNIGYEKKEFLRNMRLSDDTQFQFMKGVSHLKGTPEVFDRLTRSTFLLEASVDIDLQEEWMFRLAEFGPTPPQDTKEFTIKDSDIKTNPQLINFDEIYAGQATDITFDTSISMLPGDSRWLEQPSTTPAISFTTRTKKDSIVSDLAEEARYVKDLPNAGYLRLTDTTYRLFNLSDLPSLYDNYKDDNESMVYNLLKPTTWKDYKSYALGEVVRHKGQRWVNQVARNANKNVNGIVNAYYTTTHSDGSLNRLRIEKVVFSQDNATKVTADTTDNLSTEDPYATSIIGLEARFGAFDHTYYSVLSRDSSATGVDANGDYFMTFNFSAGTVPSANLPVDDTTVYMSAFQWKPSSNSTDPWLVQNEAGLFSVWVADATANGWESYILQDASFNIEEICKGYDTGNEALVKLNKAHYLTEGDYIFITGAENNPGLNGIHKVTGFPTGSDCATCGLRNVKQFYIDEFVNDNEAYGKLFIFRKQRFSDSSQLSSSLNDSSYSWADGSYGFVDGALTQQNIVIGQTAIADAINTAYTTAGAVSLNEYTLAYTVSLTSFTDANGDSQQVTNDIYVHIGDTKTLVPFKNSSNLANWTINDTGTKIIFNSGTIGSPWQVGKSVTIYYITKPLGYAVYSYDNENKIWTSSRTQQLKANIDNINNITIYDYNTNKTLAIAETWDPYKGIIPGIAEKELDIIASYDNALYNSTTDIDASVTSNRYWGKEEQGTTWWDLNTVRYLDYEIGNDVDYTFKNWGKQFPGSSVDVYEWTRSVVLPDEWVELVNGEFVIDEVICSGEAYHRIIDGETFYYWSETTEYDYVSDSMKTFYYFWVKNKTSVPKNNPGRELSTKDIAKYIDDPTGSGIFWASPGGASNIITGNIGDYLTKNSVLQINFKSDVDTTNKEWISIREKDNNSIPARFAERLHESILGFDKSTQLYKISGLEVDHISGNSSFNYNWQNTLDYPTGSVVQHNNKLWRTNDSITLFKTNLQLSAASGDTEIRIGTGAASAIEFPTVVTIAQPPSTHGTGQPYPDITATAYANVNASGEVTSLTVVRGGLGYDSSNPPTVFIQPPQNGTQATATATVTGTQVTGFTITDSGSGYIQNFIKINNEILETKFFNEYETNKTLVDVILNSNGDFEASASTATGWSAKNGTLSVTNTSPLAGSNSGSVAVTNQQHVYVGQRSIDITSTTLGITASTKYVAKISFKCSIQPTNVILRYGSATTDADFDGLTEVDIDTIGTPAANTIYSLTGDFTTHATHQYHALYLYVNAGSSQSFTLTVDSLEWVNVAAGDRIIVTRGQESTSAAAHNQFLVVKQLGKFDNQSWIEIPNYTWVDDQTIKVEQPKSVPDLNLNEVFRYGNQIRPYKQSWIKDKVQATRVLVDKANELLLKINLSDSQLNWTKRLGSIITLGNTDYTPSDYWDYTDWFDTNYNIDASTVAQITVSTRNELYDVDSTTYTNVRVDDDDGTGAWAFYSYIDNQWLKIGKQNGTIQLKTTLYAVSDIDNGWDAAEWDIAGWDKSYLNEYSAILHSLREDIFIGAYESYWKEMFFTLIEYIHSEQSNLDWAAKTTFLQLDRKTPGELKPRTFDIGAEKDILAYLDEVKPYHSKVETIFDARTFNEETNVNADEVVDIRVQTNLASTSGTVTAGSLYDVSSEENDCRGITFNNDGTKMFIVGTQGDDVNEYTLSAGFDLTSTVNHVGSYAVTQCPQPMSVKFNADGSKMFVTGTSNSNVHEYALGTDFTVSTASFTQTKVTTVDNNNFGLDFKPDGTKMYITGDSNNKIYEFDLSTGFDISTATFNQDLNVGAQDGEPFGIEWSPDGKKLFIVGTHGNGVDLYNVSTAWDISTATWLEFYFIGGNPSGIHISPAGTKMFIIGNDTADPTNGNHVKPYTLSYAYTFTDTSMTSTTDSRAFRMFIDNTGTRMYEAIIDELKTTLNGAITATATTIVVNDANKVPSAPGEIIIGAERIRYSEIDSSSLKGCTRGVAGTPIQTHSNNASVVSAGPTMTLAVTPDPEAYPAFSSDGTTIAGDTTIQGFDFTIGGTKAAKGTI